VTRGPGRLCPEEDMHRMAWNPLKMLLKRSSKCNTWDGGCDSGQATGREASLEAIMVTRRVSVLSRSVGREDCGRI
jgi:hypothetical protein